MRELTDMEKNQLWDEVRHDFPGDETMQQIHYVRLLHHRQTENMSVQERIQFYDAHDKSSDSSHTVDN